MIEIIIILPGMVMVLYQIPEKAKAMEDFRSSVDEMEFGHTQVYRETDLVYRSAYGDLIPSREGMEMATCSMNGKVVVTYGSGSSWNSELAHRSYHGDDRMETAQVFSIDAGDLLPEYPGDELVAVDENYAVNLIRHDEDVGWISEEIIGWPVTDDWLFEVDIGELEENGDQLEIIVVSDSRKGTLVKRTDDGWTGEVIFTDKDSLDACWIADILPEYQGNEIVFGGGRGAVSISYKDNDTWNNMDVQMLGEFITDIVVADIDKDIPGKEIYASTTAGDLFSIYRDEGSWTSDKVHSEGRVIYGLETGSVGDNEVLSIATYGHRIVLVWKDNDWSYKPVYAEEYNIMGTGVFDIDPTRKGEEVVALSYFGRVTIIFESVPGSEIVLPYDQTQALPNSYFNVPIIIEGRGGYKGQVSLSLSSAGINASLDDDTINADNITYLHVECPQQPGTYTIDIESIDPYGKSNGSIQIVVKDSIDQFHLEPTILEMDLSIDRQIVKRATIYSEEGISKDIDIKTSDVPFGIEAVPEKDRITSGTTVPINFDISFSALSVIEPGSYHFFLIASNNEGLSSSTGIIVHVKERSLSDFILAVEEPSIKAHEGSNSSVSIGVISLHGFSNRVNLSIADVPEGLEIELLESSIVPSGEVVLNISVIEAVGTYFITIVGQWEKIIREAYIRIDIEPPELGLEVIFPDEPILFEIEDQDESVSEANFIISLSPIGGTVEGISVEVIGVPENFSLTIIPNDIERLVYSIDLAISISGPVEEIPGSISINISSKEEGIFREGEILFKLNTTDGNESGENGPTIVTLVLIGLGIIMIISIVIALFVIRANSLNHHEDVKNPHENGSENNSFNAPTERGHRHVGLRNRFHR
ncbi:MAG: hypothetical protein R6V01_03110 [Thermoplasmatota archaeon]